VEVPTKFFPLLDWTWGGHPLLDKKQAKAARNFSVVKSDVGFKWMAFLEKQTKTNAYPFVMRQALPV